MKLFAPIALTVGLLAASTSAQAVINGTGCNGFAMGFAGATNLGAAYTVSVSGGPVGGAAALMVGVPSAPVDLTIIGMTGCSLMLTAPASIPRTLDGAGADSIASTITTDPGAIGLTIGMQYAAISIGANPLGVITSDQLSVTVQA